MSAVIFVAGFLCGFAGGAAFTLAVTMVALYGRRWATLLRHARD